MQVWYAARESNAANPTKASARCQVEGASLMQPAFPFNYRRRNHVCFKLMSDSARSKSKLLRDLENHLFPHTVPIKGRAQRLSVVQLDSGFGKGAEHLPDQRGRDIVREPGGFRCGSS